MAVKSPLNIRRLLYSYLLTNSLPTDGERLGVWECTTCSTCNLRCPKSCEPLDLVLETRANFVEKGRLASSLIKALENTFLHGNPFGKPREKRAEWVNKSEALVKVLKEGDEADYLLFLCCINAFDPRMQKIATSLVKVLNFLKIDFGILGEEETCCGSEIKRMGEVGLFAELREANQAIFAKRRLKGIITVSPHCYNALKNEYSLSLPVYHYTTFLCERIDSLQSSLKKMESTGLFHDPCFLGKMSRIYEPPRTLLTKVLKELKEFDRSRERSLCCEGGGGRMWIESEVKERLAQRRIQEARELKVNQIYVACPFCLSTLEDAVKVEGEEANIKIEDIAELLAQSLSE